MIDPADSTRRKTFTADATFKELLVPIFRRGARVYDSPPIADLRDRTTASLASLDPSITRFLNPHSYPVGLEKSVNDIRTELVLKARGLAENPEE
jgi:nicotinate phosphoribosyltransferase